MRLRVSHTSRASLVVYRSSHGIAAVLGRIHLIIRTRLSSRPLPLSLIGTSVVAAASLALPNSKPDGLNFGTTRSAGNSCRETTSSRVSPSKSVRRTISKSLGLWRARRETSVANEREYVAIPRPVLDQAH